MKKVNKDVPIPPPLGKRLRLKLLNKRSKVVFKMENSPSTPVTIRIPNQFFQWLDRYTHGTYKDGTTKVGLLKQALTLLYFSLGEPKEHISLDLIPTLPKTHRRK